MAALLAKVSDNLEIHINAHGKTYLHKDKARVAKSVIKCGKKGKESRRATRKYRNRFGGSKVLSVMTLLSLVKTKNGVHTCSSFTLLFPCCHVFSMCATLVYVF